MISKRFGNELHAMIDLETLSLRPNAAIGQIGTAIFRPFDEPGTFVATSNIHVKLEGQDDLGRHADFRTIQWWFGQSDEAIKSVWVAQESYALPEALERLRFFLKSHTALAEELSEGRAFHIQRAWGHGATFDPVVLASAYEACSMKFPFTYQQPRDTRTVFDMVDGGDWTDGEMHGPKHDALADAVRQTVVLQRAMQKIREG